DALPVRLLRGAHRLHEGVAVGERASAGDALQRGIRGLPLQVSVLVPIWPVHERAAEIEDDRARRCHYCRSGRRIRTFATRTSRAMTSAIVAMSGDSTRSRAR